MPVIEERLMEIGTVNWADYWTFQVGVSRFARFASESGLESIEATAEPPARSRYWASRRGKSLPTRHARDDRLRCDNGTTLADAEQRFLGWMPINSAPDSHARSRCPRHFAT